MTESNIYLTLHMKRLSVLVEARSTNHLRSWRINSRNCL